MKELEKIYYTARDGAKIEVRFFGQDADAPLIFDIHGGGFVGGNISWDDKFCEDLARAARVNVMSLEYRHYPEAVHPKAIEDCCDAFYSAATDRNLSFDRTRVYLLGHSCGAQLACSMVMKKCIGICGLILCYPFLDMAENKRKRVKGGFKRKDIKRFSVNYFPDMQTRMSPDVSVLRIGEERAKSFPETLIVVCGRDTLRPDGEKFARILLGAGVKCKLLRYDEAVHGFAEKVSRGQNIPARHMNVSLCLKQVNFYDRLLEDISSFL